MAQYYQCVSCNAFTKTFCSICNVGICNEHWSDHCKKANEFHYQSYERARKSRGIK